MTSAAQLKKIPVVEVFGPTLQGEGALAGQRTMFVRFGYCDGAGDQWCTWCDSLFAVDPKNKAEWRFIGAQQIIDELSLESRTCKVVTLSGGNPALHDLAALVRRLRLLRYKVHVETQGTIWRPWLQNCATVTVSPKPPSAGKCNVERFRKFLNKVLSSTDRPELVCKVVVDPDREDDYEFARMILEVFDDEVLRYNPAQPAARIASKYLSTLTLPTDGRGDLLARYQRLADRVVADDAFPDVAVLPQLHVILWGHARKV